MISAGLSGRRNLRPCSPSPAHAFPFLLSEIQEQLLGSVIKKRRKKMRKHKHKKMLKKTRWQRRAVR
jgi:mRNA-processing protein COX24